jgi:hypothetical protein
MRLTAFVKLVTTSGVFSAVVLTSMMGRAEDPTPTANWVNIKSPAFGAYGDGKHDDTAAIQAAIDHAFAQGLTGVYCPRGNYKTSSTIYLDPPGNMRTSGRPHPTIFQFSMSFFGDPAGGVMPAGGAGCTIAPTFDNDVGLLVGPGQGMRVSDMAIFGPGGGYRGNQPYNGVGIGLSGGNGGSSVNLIENTTVSNFYSCYMTSANGWQANTDMALNDSNTFRKVSGGNCHYGIKFFGTQSFIDDVIEPRIGGTTIAIDDEISHQVNIIGGNLSAGDGLHNTFAWSNVVYHGGCPNYGLCIDVRFASPDANLLAGLYDSFVAITSDHGAVPLQLISIDSSGSAVLAVWNAWLYQNYGNNANGGIGAALLSSIAAVPSVYASERVVVAKGFGLTLEGVHVENPSACSTLLELSSSWGGQVTNELRDIYFNTDITAPAGVENAACQQSFPLIGGSSQRFSSSGPGSVFLRGGNYDSSSYPINIDLGFQAQIRGDLLNNARFNLRVWDDAGHSYGQVARPIPFDPSGHPSLNQVPTAARGIGWWDNDYSQSAGAVSSPQMFQINGELTSPFCGYESCGYAIPNLSPTLLSLVCPGANLSSCGPLGPLGSYPPIACRTVFKSMDWNTGAVAHPFLRSASCPGYSYGQNLTDSLVGGTITYQGTYGSSVVYLDANTMNWMFPGLTVTLDGDPYTVTSVYPSFGYVSVIYAGDPAGGLLQRSYSCSSSCSIGQASFAWTAY